MITLVMVHTNNYQNPHIFFSTIIYGKKISLVSLMQLYNKRIAYILQRHLC